MDEFRKELEELINKHSMEQASSTPDFLLAYYLVNCLMIFNGVLEQRAKWYEQPTNTSEAPPDNPKKNSESNCVR